jgi:aryl-alcohol dehydrogenase-like predicted oxidoreductase
VLISVKFGMQRGPHGPALGFDARPAAVKTALAYSLRRLGTDYIDIYRPARVDPDVPIEETVGAIADMVRAGYVRSIGLSEAGVESLRRAQAVHPIVDLQIEYSLLSCGIEPAILPACRELGIGITAYGVLSRGLLGGRWSHERSTTPGDFRSRGPRFQGENLEHNLRLVEALRSLAEARGTTVSRIAIAWVLSRGEDIVPLIGARRREQLGDALAALDLALTPEDLRRIEEAIPPGAAAGNRYDTRAMAHLDSER